MPWQHFQEFYCTSLDIEMGTYTKFLRNPQMRKMLIRRCSTKPKKESDAKPKLPKLPVPPLEQTLSRFLRSARPFVESDEYSRLEGMVKSFGAPGGQGECLQELLEKKNETAEPSWLHEIWLNAAYLGYRNPVVVYSNPALIFPKQKFNSEEDYVMCAAKMLVGAVSYKVMLDEGNLAKETVGGAPLCMSQYHLVYGTNRSPSIPLDNLKFNPKSEHIIVMHNNHFFKLKVKKGNKCIGVKEAYHNVKEIIKNSACLTAPVGILTTDRRDCWAEAYSDLIKDGVTSSSIETIEQSLFILCLDGVCPIPCVNNMTTTAAQILHGGGPGSNTGNRWFDKTLQFIVGRDGGIGINQEHSPAEAIIVTAIQDYIVPLLEKGVSVDESCSCPPLFEELTFNLSDFAKKAISVAQCNVNELVNNVELCCFSFNDFGKEGLKQLKVSPDSFIQVAIQLAFFRMHHVPGAQYETGTLRMYRQGRTEAIRSCLEEVVTFTRAMGNKDLGTSSKARALRSAMRAQREYTLAAMSMKGIDRHFLALKILSAENNMVLHDLFNSSGYVKSSHYRLSTSQVASKENGVMAYGPLTADGYGCCYNPRESNINFGISSFASYPETNAFIFKDHLEQSLKDMKEALSADTPAKL